MLILLEFLFIVSPNNEVTGLSGAGQLLSLSSKIIGEVEEKTEPPEEVVEGDWEFLWRRQVVIEETWLLMYANAYIKQEVQGYTVTIIFHSYLLSILGYKSYLFHWLIVLVIG